MTQNKIIRVQSANVIRRASMNQENGQHSSFSRPQQWNGNSKTVHVEKQVQQKLLKLKIEEQQNRFQSSRNQFRKLTTSHSKGRLKKNSIELGYNSKSWRTINSARSIERLSSLDRFQTLNPIKINLQEKVNRIKTKQCEIEKRTIEQEQQIARKISRQIENENVRFKEGLQQGRVLKRKINEILSQWERQKTKAKSDRRQIVKNKLDQFNLNQQRTKPINMKKQFVINWRID